MHCLTWREIEGVQGMKMLIRQALLIKRRIGIENKNIKTLDRIDVDS